MALVELSPYVDVALMTTIAQSAATFIAITAGFFTTKIISLSTEKSKLERQKNETESKFRTLKEKEARLDGKREEILVRKARERVDGLVDEINFNPQDYSLSNLGDLIASFENYYQFHPTERQIKILTERKDEIIAQWHKHKEQEELDKKEYPDRKKVWALNSPTVSAKTTDAVNTTYEHSVFTNIDNELNETRYQISNLQDDQKRIQDELQDVTYPKHARFGFLSFIVFAGIGVIIPMAYRLWGTFFIDLSSNYPLILEYLPLSNSVVIILFLAGLALNFVYIYFEVHTSLKNPKTSLNSGEK